MRNVRLRMRTVWVTCSCIFGLLQLSGCSMKPDTDAEFAMAMNGNRYLSRMRPPIGYVREIDFGYEVARRYTVLFPSRFPTPLPRPGLEIAFDPERVYLGEALTFEEAGVRVEYFPAHGHKWNKATLLIFSSDRRGGGEIRFDVLEPRLGGRVKGTILHATLHGYYENAETVEITEPKKPRKLELWNFPFDVTLERSPFG